MRLLMWSKSQNWANYFKSCVIPYEDVIFSTKEIFGGDNILASLATENQNVFVSYSENGKATLRVANNVISNRIMSRIPPKLTLKLNLEIINAIHHRFGRFFLDMYLIKTNYVSFFMLAEIIACSEFKIAVNDERCIPWHSSVYQVLDARKKVVSSQDYVDFHRDIKTKCAALFIVFYQLELAIFNAVIGSVVVKIQNISNQGAAEDLIYSNKLAKRLCHLMVVEQSVDRKRAIYLNLMLVLTTTPRKRS